MEKRKWEILYEEESENPGFKGFYRGIITNGKGFLFYDADDADNDCRIYTSIENLACGIFEREFTWDAKNWCILLNALNELSFEDSYCNMGEFLSTIEFN